MIATRLSARSALLCASVLLPLAACSPEAKKDRGPPKVGFADVLLKPMSISLLHDALKQYQARQQSAETIPDANTHYDFTGYRLLLAEDDPINREVAEAILEETGCTLDMVENGEQAIQRVSEVSYDLILMDMQMPVLDGVEATQRLRARSDIRQIPIIAMTANAFSEDRQACMAAGMNDFITKPVEPELFYATLRHWLPARQGE